jgi:asparagine synthase (glutamine-hydrolysing)
MQNQLLKDSDYMSMWHSIEIRVPFLDKELIKLAYQISPNIKAFGGQKKYLLIHALGNLLPRAIWDRPKMGFTFPFQRWLGSSTLALAEEGDSYADGKFKRGEYTWSRYWATKMIK